MPLSLRWYDNISDWMVKRFLKYRVHRFVLDSQQLKTEHNICTTNLKLHFNVVSWLHLCSYMTDHTIYHLRIWQSNTSAKPCIRPTTTSHKTEDNHINLPVSRVVISEDSSRINSLVSLFSWFYSQTQQKMPGKKNHLGKTPVILPDNKIPKILDASDKDIDVATN